MGKHSSREEYNEYMRVYMLRRYHERRSTALQHLGGKCVQCGSVEELELHHIDPSQKSFNLSHSWSVSQPRWDAEVAKCEILCDPCHREHHRSHHPHGTVHRYWRGCRCGACKAAMSVHNREYRAQRKQNL